ncbi:MAG TPA: hypothetical protein VIY90_15715 [Steroidobacteraceae bacterium]
MKTLVVILLAGLLLPVAAAAAEWTVYTYPDPGFTIQFPGVPAVQASRIRNSTGVSLPMTRYSVRQDRVMFTLSVVNYSSTNADALSTIAETERSIGASNKVTAARGARVNGSFGRELSVNGPDGSRSAIAIFFVNKHLYTLVGQALPPNAGEESDDTIHFQESLQFLDDNVGFGALFGGGGRDRSSDAGRSRPSSAGASADAARLRGASNPPADAACAGKSAGDAVQLETPGGPVSATCTLVARPNAPAP